MLLQTLKDTGQKFIVNNSNLSIIKDSINRAMNFMTSQEYLTLKDELNNKVKRVEKAILAASRIDNVNLRGRIIEYLIEGPEDDTKINVINNLINGHPLPEDVQTVNTLGDYKRSFEKYTIETDIKTKIMLAKSSNPKGYNIDKLLRFLSQDKSVYMIYLIGINPETEEIKLKLCSMFDKNLNGRIYDHWAGRNSRGEFQFDGTNLENALTTNDNTLIDKNYAIEFLQKLIES